MNEKFYVLVAEGDIYKNLSQAISEAKSSADECSLNYHVFEATKELGVATYKCAEWVPSEE